MTKLKIIGLFPAAGHATRLGITDCSKEILVVPDFRSLADTPDSSATLAVGDYLVRAYYEAGIKDIIIIRRPEKADIATHYNQQKFVQLRFQHVITEPTPGTPHTLLKAFDLFKEQRVALGFPDIILQAPGIFEQLLSKLQYSQSDACLALFPAVNPAHSDTVATDGDSVRGIEVKNPQSPHPYSWYCAVWQPRFSQFFSDFVANKRTIEKFAIAQQELYVGHVFQAALREGFTISQVTFDKGIAQDIGRREDLNRIRAMRPD